MHLFNFALASLLLGLLSYQNLVAAEPALTTDTLESRGGPPRYNISWRNCNPTQQKRLLTGFEDARQLAWAAQNIDPVKSHSCSHHYFRNDDTGNAQDFSNAKSYYNVIADGKGYENQFKWIWFAVDCASPGANGNCTDETVTAIAQNDPHDDWQYTPNGGGLPVMTICPSFWSSDETQNDLSTRKFSSKSNGWCQNQPLQWYEVAGYILLRELSRLNCVGALAKITNSAIGLPSADAGMPHGTGYTLGDPSLRAAWNLTTYWQLSFAVMTKQFARTRDEFLLPSRNAASIAGLALEWYMTTSCANAKAPIDEIKIG